MGERKASLELYIAVLACIVQSMQYGIGLGMVNNCATPVKEFIGKIKPNADISYLWSIVVSSFALGGIFGGLLAGPIVNKLGSKKTMVLNDVVFMIGGILLAYTARYEYIIAGRILLGFGSGMCCTCVPNYVNEVCPTSKLKGALGIGHQAFITFGVFLINVLGMSTVLGNERYWRYIYGSPLVVGILHLFLVLFLCPETPYELVKRKQYEEARNVLCVLRDSKSDANRIEEELSSIIAEHKETEKRDMVVASTDIDHESMPLNQTSESATTNLSIFQQLRLVCCDSYYTLPFLSAMLMHISQQLSGINAIIFFSSELFMKVLVNDTQNSASADNNEISNELKAQISTSVLMFVGFFPSFITPKLMTIYGRKPLMLTSFLGMFTFHFLFVVTLFFRGKAWQLIGLASTVVFMLFFQIGAGPIPWMIANELAPVKTREATQGIGCFVNWSIVFLLGLEFESIKQGVGEKGVFSFFAAMCGIFFVAIWYTLPETKGKSREYIDSYYAKLIRR